MAGAMGQTWQRYPGQERTTQLDQGAFANQTLGIAELSNPDPHFPTRCLEQAPQFAKGIHGIDHGLALRLGRGLKRILDVVHDRVLGVLNPPGQIVGIGFKDGGFD